MNLISTILQCIQMTGEFLGWITAAVVLLMLRLFVTHKDLQVRFNQHDVVHEQITVKLTKLNTDFEHMPSGRDIANVTALVSDAREDIAGIKATTEGFGETLRVLQHGQQEILRAALNRS